MENNIKPEEFEETKKNNEMEKYDRIHGEFLPYCDSYCKRIKCNKECKFYDRFFNSIMTNMKYCFENDDIFSLNKDYGERFYNQIEDRIGE